mmetsp:Transcript_7220/g.20341  ORF Transcript_7220/g.20341 Transcript_7220/m.20341 type:complete len:238 (-) Transcript_7220:707-1420(-)
MLYPLLVETICGAFWRLAEPNALLLARSVHSFASERHRRHQSRAVVKPPLAIESYQINLEINQSKSKHLRDHGLLGWRHDPRLQEVVQEEVVRVHPAAQGIEVRELGVPLGEVRVGGVVLLAPVGHALKLLGGELLKATREQLEHGGVAGGLARALHDEADHRVGATPRLRAEPDVIPGNVAHAGEDRGVQVGRDLVLEVRERLGPCRDRRGALLHRHEHLHLGVELAVLVGRAAVR